MVIYDIKYRNICFFAACSTSLKHNITHGTWVDPRLEVEDMKMDIADMLAASLFAGKNNWCITYFEAPLPFRFLNSHTTLVQLHKMACFIEEFNIADFGAKLLDRYWGNVDEAKHVLFNDYMGDFDNISDFVKSYLKGHTQTPHSIIDAVNTKKLWHDWRQDKFFVIPTPPHGVQIFRKCGKVIL